MLVAALTLAAAALRLHLLSTQSIWIDEATSITLAKMAWWPFLRLLWGYQGNMTLYYFLLRAWIHLGDSEAAVRGLSVLFGVLTIPVIYALGARMFSRTTGVLSAALLSIHSFHIQWSQEARAYSLLTFLLVTTAYFFVRAMDSPRPNRYWAVFTLSAALSVYAHVFAVLALPAYALCVLYARPFRVRLVTLLLAGASFVLLILPMSAFVLLHHSNQINWIPRPTLADMGGFLQLLTGSAGWYAAAFYLLAASAAVAAAILRPSSDKERWSVRFLALWLAAPPLLTIAVSPWKPLFFSRYMVMCVPALVMLAAHGLARFISIRGLARAAASAALVLLILISGWGTERYFGASFHQTEDWRGAAGYILSQQRAGDGALFYIPNIYSYTYYVQHLQTRNQSQPAILYPSTPRHSLTPELIKQATAGRRRVWLVLCNESVNPAAAGMIETTMDKSFTPVETKIFAGEDPITLILYSQPAPASE